MKKLLSSIVVATLLVSGTPALAQRNDQSVARKAAFEKAQAQATEYARWAGYSGVRLLSVSEAVNPGRPMPYAERAMAASMDAKASPVEPGLVGTAVTVSVTFEMTR